MASSSSAGIWRKQTAESGDRKEGKTLCRYFVHGVCRYGDNCRFSHDRHDKPNLVCTFHKKGVCAYGKECRYDHVRDRKDNHKTLHSASQAQVKSITEASFASLDENWADAAEFVPGQLYSPRAISSYSGVVKDVNNGVLEGSFHQENQPQPQPGQEDELCPFYLMGKCQYGEECLYIHGTVCDMCDLPILHPTDVKQQERHKEECLASHEEDMKESFKVAQSCEVTCGICMEVVWEKKEKRERKFGILENCCHAFCLDCIRKWRSAKSFNNTVVKACPECRVSSSFVTPSDNWVSDPDEKKKLIDGYKEHLSKKPCKHFDQGRRSCPFGANCFYRHSYPDGTLQDRSKIPKRAKNSDGHWHTFDPSTLWEFIEDRDDFMDFDDESLDFFDLVYLLGASDGLRDDDSDSYDRWDLLLGVGHSDSEDSDF